MASPISAGSDRGYRKRLRLHTDAELDPTTGEVKTEVNRLANLEGVTTVGVELDEISIEYDIRQVTGAQLLRAVEGPTIRVGAGLFERLRLWLHCYCDAVHQDGLSHDAGWDSYVREIYVSRYRHRRHGRRDDRPHHWRQYEKRSADGDVDPHVE